MLTLLTKISHNYKKMSNVDFYLFISFLQGSNPPSRDISPNSNPNHPPQRQQIQKHHNRSKYIKSSSSSHRPGLTPHLKRKKHSKQNSHHRNDIE